jgi:hypothetical protein
MISFILTVALAAPCTINKPRKHHKHKPVAACVQVTAAPRVIFLPAPDPLPPVVQTVYVPTPVPAQTVYEPVEYTYVDDSVAWFVLGGGSVVTTSVTNELPRTHAPTRPTPVHTFTPCCADPHDVAHVPEIDAQGAAAALTVLACALLILIGRRREGP